MKKKIFSLLVLLAAAVSGAWAEEVTIGDGTTTTYVTPYNSLWGYSYVQQVYTADEIGMAGTISSIAFCLSSTDDQTNEFDIFMKHVTRETFESPADFETVTADNIVYSGSITFSQGWTTITLDTPFEYDGTQNLMIALHEKTSGYSTRYFYYTSKANSVISFHSDSDNPNPYEIGTYGGNKYTQQNRANIKIEIEDSNPGFKLTTDESEHGTLTFTNAAGETIKKAEEGEVVTVTVTPDEGWRYDNISAYVYTTWGSRGMSKTSSIPVVRDITLEGSAPSWTFTMPAANVGFTVGYVKQSTVSFNPTTTENLTVTLDGETVTPEEGKLLKVEPDQVVTFAANNGYLLSNVSVDDTDLSESEGIYTFSMPAFDVEADFTIRRDLTNAVTATVASADGRKRFRIKQEEDGHYTSYEFTTLEEVLGLVSVKDEINGTELTIGEDYSLYILDEDENTIEIQQFVTNLKPGDYKLQVIGINDHVNTVISNVFKLYELDENSFDLREELYKEYESYEEPGTGTPADHVYTVGEPSATVYGEGEDNNQKWADISTFEELIVVASSGTPRFFINNTTDLAKYVTVSEEDGLYTYTVNLSAIQADYGFVRLHSIKSEDENDELTAEYIILRNVPGDASLYEAMASLRMILAHAKEADVTKKTAASVKALNKAIANAEQELASPDVSKVGCDEARFALKKALEGLKDVTTSISGVEEENEQYVWYDLNGRRMQGEPTKAGVYVVNGKKIQSKGNR